MLAAVLIGVIGIGGIMLIDIVTFLVAIGALLLVFIPQPEMSEAGRQAQGSLWQDSIFGFKYIFHIPSLLGLQLSFFATNLIGTLAFTLTAPMILARTAQDQLVLGTVLSVAGVGGVLGGLLLSVWGGPKRKINGVLIGFTLESLLGTLVIGLSSGLVGWSIGVFFSGFMIPILNGSNQAIWQAKVQPDLQGRVFATRRLIAQITIPLAMLITGPLADRVFEPAMMPGGAWASIFGGLVGAGPGSGMSLIFVISGLLGALVGLVGYAIPAIRNVETILPDYDAVSLKPAVEGSAAA